MDEDDEITVELAPGSEVTIKFKALGELQPNGKREVFFETYGVPRVIEMLDRKTNPDARITREKADTNSIGDIGAPMTGDILSVRPAPHPVFCALSGTLCFCASYLASVRLDPGWGGPCQLPCSVYPYQRRVIGVI